MMKFFSPWCCLRRRRNSAFNPMHLPTCSMPGKSGCRACTNYEKQAAYPGCIDQSAEQYPQTEKVKREKVATLSLHLEYSGCEAKPLNLLNLPTCPFLRSRGEMGRACSSYFKNTRDGDEWPCPEACQQTVSKNDRETSCLTSPEACCPHRWIQKFFLNRSTRPSADKQRCPCTGWPCPDQRGLHKTQLPDCLAHSTLVEDSTGWIAKIEDRLKRLEALLIMRAKNNLPQNEETKGCHSKCSLHSGLKSWLVAGKYCLQPDPKADGLCAKLSPRNDV